MDTNESFDTSEIDTSEADSSVGRGAVGKRAIALGSAAVLATSGAGLSLAVTTGAAGAASFDVTTCADSGAGSLRQAILDAEAAAGADVITVTAECTISSPVLVSSQMEITDDLSIVGPGATSFVLDGDDATRIITVFGQGVEFSLSGVTLTNGYAGTGSGGALEVNNNSGNGGALSLDGVVVSSSEAGYGGGVSIEGTDTVYITNTTIIDNEASSDGGGFYTLYNGDTVIINSTISNNVSGDNGGGLSNYEHQGDFGLFNSTITGNSSSASGGGLYFDGLYGEIAAFGFLTVANNTAGSGLGGVYISDDEDAAILMFSSIFSGNSGDQVGIYRSGVTTFNNIFDGGVDGFTPSASDLIDVDPELGPLADNGGLTPTHAIAETSPAIDAGTDPVPDFPGSEYDQRGEGYTRTYNGRADIGAYEWQPGEEPEPVTPSFTG